MPQLSIVIPSPGDAPCFETTLASVLQNRPPHCEVIVVQPRVYDDPYDLGSEVTFLAAPSDARLTELIQVGVDRAVSPIVHLLSCSVEVVDGWFGSVPGHFDDPSVGSVSPSVFLQKSKANTCVCGITFGRGGRRRHIRPSRRSGQCDVLGPSIHGGFFRRLLLSRILNHCVRTNAECLDADLALSLARLGFCCQHESESCLRLSQTPDNSRRHRYGSAIADGMTEEHIFWRHLQRDSVAFSLFAHLSLVLGETFTGLVRPRQFFKTLGRIPGLLSMTDCLGHYDRLESAEFQSSGGAGGGRVAERRAVDRHLSERSVGRRRAA